MTDPHQSTLLFIGDITGQPALEYLEAQLPAWLSAHPTDFVIANAENLTVSGNGAGMTRAALERLFAAGVRLVTGGNHSWDGPEGATVHADPRVLRPLNVSPEHSGRGAGIVTSSRGRRLGVVNVAGRSAIPHVNDPLSAIEQQLERWDVDAVLVDVHGESVFEKTSLAFALIGRIAALLGTHTHVQTGDARVLAGGVAVVSDVGMTGPTGGVQGYDPTGFVNRLRNPSDAQRPLELASGPIELGAVRVWLEGARATRIERVNTLAGLPSTIARTEQTRARERRKELSPLAVKR